MGSITPTFGWAGPEPVDIMITNRTGGAVAIGAMLLLDNRRSDAASTNNIVGSTAAGLANGVTPIALAFDSASAGIYGVVLQAMGTARTGRIRLKGAVDFATTGAAVVLANARGVVTGASTNIRIVSAATETTAAAAAIATKVVFLPLTALAGAGTTDGWFNGIEGFGTILLT